jgi:uncharacterized protein YceK
MRVVAVVAMVVLLAGCTGEPPASTEPSPTASGSASSSSAAPAQARAWVPSEMAVTFDGNLGTSLHGCVFPAGLCDTMAVTTDSSDLTVERAGTNFTGLDLTVTWTAQSPATATLTLGFMVMASCDGCNSTVYDEVTGTSPLHAAVSGANVPLDADHALHVYLYNPQGLVYDPAVPGYAFVSVDQAFHVEGTVSLLLPPTAGAPAA